MQNFKATDRLVVMLINYYMFNQLNHLCINFDIDVNGGESDTKKHSIGKKVEHDLVFLELRYFFIYVAINVKGGDF